MVESVKGKKHAKVKKLYQLKYRVLFAIQIYTFIINMRSVSSYLGVYLS